MGKTKKDAGIMTQCRHIFFYKTSLPLSKPELAHFKDICNHPQKRRDQRDKKKVMWSVACGGVKWRWGKDRCA